MAIDAPGLEAAIAVENRNRVLCSRTKDAQRYASIYREKTAGYQGR